VFRASSIDRRARFVGIAVMPRDPFSLSASMMGMTANATRNRAAARVAATVSIGDQTLPAIGVTQVGATQAVRHGGPISVWSVTTSFIAACGSGRSTSFIPAVPAAWSVTTIAFMMIFSRLTLLLELFRLPADQFVKTPALHLRVEHFQDSAPGADLVVMGEIGEAFENAEQLLVPGVAPDLHIAGAALRAERPKARQLVATLRSRRCGEAVER
jgi:hypothetical protein